MTSPHPVSSLPFSQYCTVLLLSVLYSSYHYCTNAKEDVKYYDFSAPCEFSACLWFRLPKLQ